MTNFHCDFEGVPPDDPETDGITVNFLSGWTTMPTVFPDTVCFQIQTADGEASVGITLEDMDRMCEEWVKARGGISLSHSEACSLINE